MTVDRPESCSPCPDLITQIIDNRDAETYVWLNSGTAKTYGDMKIYVVMACHTFILNITIRNMYDYTNELTVSNTVLAMVARKCIL